ncbi:MAG: bifunctional 5,10-methylenetetrahydrofolate dehydrogenase/5,10-methenyltetrahydrofolate cyclohydrolase [Bacilli bacterium]|jgi:methylenetetrahydrofolate dehydrogenase (NADP+)/methenyltetrahydrofolate cyclohydrolase
MTIKQYVAEQKQELSNYVKTLSRAPRFTIIQVNDDPASNSYIRGKIKDANEIGVIADLIKLPETTSEEELLKIVEKCNKDPEIAGLIVQLPLPKQISEDKVKLAIDPKKDIDGFHPLSKLNPCTPMGIIDYLKHENIEIEGKNALVIGRSNIVGKPMAKLLLNNNATVTVAHSRTPKEELDKYLANADIIVVAVGRKYFIDNQKMKKIAVIVDVGINRVDGVLYGDVRPGQDVYLQTPVPGGVGLLTRLRLLKNLMEAYNNGI